MVKKLTLTDMIMLYAFKHMRQIIQSKGTKKQKEIALNAIFWKANKMIDVNEGRE